MIANKADALAEIARLDCIIEEQSGSIAKQREIIENLNRGWPATISSRPFEIATVHWEYEDTLPEMSDADCESIYEWSEIKDGVRMFPYITIYGSDGTETRHFLGV